MRALVALALALGALLAWLAWREPGETKAAVLAADAAAPPPAVVDVDAPVAARRTEVAAPPPSDPTARIGRLRLVDANTTQPLAEQPLRLWVFASGKNLQFHLRSDREGMVQFEATAEQLAPGHSYAAEITLEEFAGAIVVPSERASDLTATPPPTLKVARGAWREVFVGDEQGVPVAGATLTGEPMHAVQTDARGHARVCLALPSQTWLEVCAPSFRQQLAKVPPPEEPWRIVLRRAHRLEFTLLGDASEGYHLELDLPAEFAQRQFYQSRVVQTPGRPVDDTSAEWTSRHRSGSHWTLAFAAQGRATLDQLDDDGTIALALYRFDELVSRRELTLGPPRGITRVELQGAAPRDPWTLSLEDPARRPAAHVFVRLAHAAAIGDLAGARVGFPIWAPMVRSDARGQCVLPRPPSDDTLVVAEGAGFATAVWSWRELQAAGNRATLQLGCNVKLELLGRNGEELIEGETTGYRARVLPYAILPHGRHLYPAEENVPRFHFMGLPPGVVEFGFSHLPDLRVRHDTATGYLRVDADTSVAELMLGK